MGTRHDGRAIQQKSQTEMTWGTGQVPSTDELVHSGQPCDGPKLPSNHVSGTNVSTTSLSSLQ
eukprot:SM000049S16691  [mRNA]  locus=s49:11430:11755:- [translate_table: standard]